MVRRARFLATVTATLLACGGCNAILGIGAHTLAQTNDASTADADAAGDAPVDGNSDGPDAESDVAGDGGVDSCSSGRWCSMFTSTTQTPNALLGTWGSAPDDVWAVGDAGTILHWNGVVWSRTPNAVDPSLGAIVDQSLRAIWGSGPTDVWAVGQDVDKSAGLVLRWDGTKWNKVTIEPPTTQPFTGVWASADGTVVIAVAEGGAIFRCDRKTETCSPDPNPMPSAFVGYAFSSVWGSGSSDIWAVGARGTIVHNDGNAWTDDTNQAPSMQSLSHVWGTGPRDVWAVGDGGTIIHWNGSAWAGSPNPSVTTRDLKSVSGEPGATSSDGAWIVGEAGTALRLSNQVWLDRSSSGATTKTLNGVLANGPGDVWAIGDDDTIVHWDGTSWSDGTTTAAGMGELVKIPGILKSVWGSGTDDVWAVGEAGAILHWDGTAWFGVQSGMTTHLTNGPLTHVWGYASDDVWAVGNRSDLGDTILHWDGHAWCALSSGTCATTVSTPPSTITIPEPLGPGIDLTGVWTGRSNDVWVVGTGGTILHWNTELGWTDNSCPLVTNSLNAVWSSGPDDDLWVVGDDGTTLRLSKGVCTNERDRHPTVTQRISGVWGSGPGDVWFVGDQQTILHRLGDSSWSNLSNPTRSTSPENLFGVWGRGATDIWAVGNAGTILHMDMSGAWTPSPSGVANFFDGVWGSGSGEVWVVGEDGLILQH